MTTIWVSFLFGTLLTFWGGYDLARYMQSKQHNHLIYVVVSTTIGVLNLIASVWR